MLEDFETKLLKVIEDGKEPRLQQLYDKLIWKTSYSEKEKEFMYWWGDRANFHEELALSHAMTTNYSDWRILSTDPDGYLVVLRRKLRYATPEEKQLIQSAIKIAKEIKKETHKASAQRKKERALSVRIQDVCEAYGKEVNRDTCLCPLHSEDTPSFKIYSNNSFYCFGCGKGGDVVDLIMELENCDFVEAIRILNTL